MGEWRVVRQETQVLVWILKYFNLFFCVCETKLWNNFTFTATKFYKYKETASNKFQWFIPFNFFSVFFNYTLWYKQQSGTTLIEVS